MPSYRARISNTKSGISFRSLEYRIRKEPDPGIANRSRDIHDSAHMPESLIIP